MANLRSSSSLFEVETDCIEAKNLIAALVSFCEQVEHLGLRYTLHHTECMPVPIDGEPPSPVRTSIRLSELRAIEKFEDAIAFRAIPPRVLELFAELDATNWLSNVGNHISDRTVECGGASNLERKDGSWHYAINEAQNHKSEALCYSHHYHFVRRWNPFALALAPLVDALMERKSKLIPERIPRTYELLFSLCAVVRAGCFDEYFRDVISPTHGKWLKWIRLGHIPCGWKGRFPNGHLVVW